MRTASLALGLVLLPTAGFADPVGTVAYTFHVHSAAMLRGSYGRAVLQIGGYRNNAAGATLRWSRENRFAPP